MDEAFRRFEANASGYAAYRPAYPSSIIARLAEAVLAEEMPAGAAIVDIGAGTGIVTRQLAEALPADLPIIGVEPATAMRREAEANPRTPGNVTYCDGLAEALPVQDGCARAVVAATAAHWFDRPRFYGEAARVLAPSGVLAILDYIRDVGASPGAAAMARFLRDRGGPQVYERPDYLREIAALPGFEGPVAVEDHGAVPVSAEGFAGLVLSSSHAQPIIAASGRDASWADLVAIGHTLADGAGRISIGYRFRLAMARRAR